MTQTEQVILDGVLGGIIGAVLVLAWDHYIDGFRDWWYEWKHRNDPPHKPADLKFWDECLRSTNYRWQAEVAAQLFDKWRRERLVGEHAGAHWHGLEPDIIIVDEAAEYDPNFEEWHDFGE